MSADPEKSPDRCGWCTASQLYIDYHDTEWGIPCYIDQDLFELLNLEGAQAGLSWITILNKRENYRRAFDGFDPARIARYTDRKIEKLLQDPGIVRNRLKVNGVITNARLYNDMQKNGESFARFLWSFVDFKPVQNKRKNLAEVPATTPAAEEMSKALKKLGFKFVGSTICYAFMQASGMVNDHVVTCAHWKTSRAAAGSVVKPGNW